MTASLPLSVFIITKNEEERIGAAVASVAGWVAEVVVVDSGSTDRTLEIAKENGATTILHNDWQGYGQQKRFAEDACAHDWLLNIDADEVVSPELRAEITALFADGKTPELDAYFFPIRFRFAHEKKSHPWAYANSPVRLYHRQRARFREHTVHDSVVPFEENKTIWRTGKLRGEVYHTSFLSLAHVAEKLNGYSSMQAEDMWQKGRKPSALRVMAEPFLAFFKTYFLRRHFVHGLHGLSYAVICATIRMMRFAKTRELFLQRGDPPERS